MTSAVVGMVDEKTGGVLCAVVEEGGEVPDAGVVLAAHYEDDAQALRDLINLGRVQRIDAPPVQSIKGASYQPLPFADHKAFARVAGKDTGSVVYLRGRYGTWSHLGEVGDDGMPQWLPLAWTMESLGIEYGVAPTSPHTGIKTLDPITVEYM